MNSSTKILLSIPSSLNVAYTFTLLFPQDFAWLYPTMDAYHLQVVGVWILKIAVMVILIKRLWSFKNIEKSLKSEWTAWVIFFFSIASLILLWRKMNELERKNLKKTVEIE